MERLKKLSDQRIGLERGRVRLEAYNPRWKRIYSDEAYFIFDNLKNESLRLYHCGSTSVDGLDSKPILDILGSVRSLAELDGQKDRLEKIGYEYKGEYGIQGRRYCVLYNPEKSAAYVHLHLFEHGSSEIEKHLLFRDQLRLSQTGKAEYLKHKKHLIEELKVERDKYSSAKQALIDTIQNEANQLANKPKKVFAVTMFGDSKSNTEKFLHETYPENLEVMDFQTHPVFPYGSPESTGDAFYTMIEKAINADLFVITTPVYWYAMSGPMKDFIDRFSNLLSGEYKSYGEALYGKRVQLLVTGYDLNLPLGFEVPFSGISIYFGMDYMGALYKSSR